MKSKDNKQKKQFRELTDEDLKNVTGGLLGYYEAPEPQCDSSFTCGEGQSVYMSMRDGHCYCGEAVTLPPMPPLPPIE